MVMDQGKRPPFDPKKAVARFIPALHEYHVGRLRLDNYAGNTFVSDFAAEFSCEVYKKSASDLYEELEPRLNAGEIELLDVSTLVEQLSGLVWKGNKITHLGLEHDDWCNAAAGALLSAVRKRAHDVPDVALGCRSRLLELTRFRRQPRDAATFAAACCFSKSIGLT